MKHGVVVNDRLTVGRYLDEWLAAKSDIRPSTLRGYQQHITSTYARGSGTSASPTCGSRTSRNAWPM